MQFDEFWIYDFNTQLHEPLDRVKVSELPARHAALNFLYPRKFTPDFRQQLGGGHPRSRPEMSPLSFNSLVARGESRATARRFILQSVVAMFSEDIGLLPESIFTSLLEECRAADPPPQLRFDWRTFPPDERSQARARRTLSPAWIISTADSLPRSNPSNFSRRNRFAALKLRKRIGRASNPLFSAHSLKAAC